MLAGSAGHFLANLAFGLAARCTTPAPLTVFCSVDHMGMRYRHRLRINVEIWRTVGERPFARLSHLLRDETFFAA